MLTSYNGTAITYDQIGNPLSYYNGTAYTFTWEGRQLISAVKGSNTMSFTYDDSGIRTSKTINGVEHTYQLNGSQIVAESWGDKLIVYLYDSTGMPIGMMYRTTSYDTTVWDTFWYEKNLQGDIVAIYDSEGALCISYIYDAWGNCHASYETGYNTSVARLNPFRYRGYYYDDDLKLYYLQSRYYDPNTCRFINADGALGQMGNVQGANMFAYCFNNPVNMSDPTGNWPKLSTIFAVVAVAAVAVAAVAAVVVTCGAAAPAMAVVGGGIAGGISAGTIATAVTVGSAAVTVAKVAAVASAASYVTEKAVEKTTERNNSVYVLKDDTGKVQYVGRTKSVDKRRAAHAANPHRAGLKMEVIASGLNLPESRALEQAGMAYYHTINTANKMNNQINSVSPNYWDAFKEIALGVLDYGWNQMSNEILYWTEN